MKKIFNISACFLLGSLWLVPVMKIILFFSGMVFTVNYNIFAPFVLFASLFILTFGCIYRIKTKSVLVSLLFPCSAFDLILCLCATGFSVWTFIMFVTAIICLIVGFDKGEKIVTKWICVLLGLSLCVVILTPLGAIFAFASLMADMSEVTVVKTIDSVDGRYVAIVKDSDEGALGGSTLVDVKDKSFHLNALAFEVEKKPVRVYSAGYGDWKNIDVYWEYMEIGWTKNNILVINGKEFVFE